MTDETGTDDAPVHDSPEEAARSTLPVLQDMVGASPALMAERAEGEGGSDGLELGAPLRSYFIALDAIAAFEPGSTDVDELLAGGDHVTFPVLRGGSTVSSVSVAAAPGSGWVVEAMGSPNQTRSITAARDDHAVETGREPSDYFVVSIPAIKAVFVATRSDGRLLLGHLHDDAELGFASGDWRPAQEVFTALVPRSQTLQRDWIEGHGVPGGPAPDEPPHRDPQAR